MIDDQDNTSSPQDIPDIKPDTTSIAPQSVDKVIPIDTTIEEVVISNNSQTVLAENLPEPINDEVDVPETPYPADLPTPMESKNTIQEYSHIRKDTENMVLSAEEEFLPHLAAPIADTIKVFAAIPEASDTDTEESRDWQKTIGDSVNFAPVSERFTDTVERPNAQYRQYMQTEKGRVGYGVPKFQDKDSPKVAGEKAILRVRALMGMGSLISIPLWHSGFWITIRTPNDSALLELRRRLREDKVQLGRATFGLIFSNEQAYTIGWLLDMVMEHFYDSTLKDQTNIRSRIKTPDLQVLFWGLACTIWPNGYQYSRSIITEEGVKEKTIVTGKIDVAKLMWVDNASFTNHQKAHMSNRIPGTVTEDALNRYLDDFPLLKGRTVEINENVKININTPSAEEYIQNGQRWISDVISLVDRAFTSDTVDASSRKAALKENAQATIIRRFGHWIESITVDDTDHKDKDTINGVLDVLSGDKQVRSKINSEIGKYIDLSLIHI